MCFYLILFFIVQDAHNAMLDFDEHGALFAVYDGHGGHEVAEYTADHLPNYILQNANYKKGNFAKVPYIFSLDMQCNLPLIFFIYFYWLVLDIKLI